MPIDPAAKIAAMERKHARYAESKGKHAHARKRRRKHTRLSPAENAIIGEIVRDQPGQIVTLKQIEQTAELLRRDPKTIQTAISKARETLQNRADYYVDVHKQALDGALKAEDYDVARKGAMEMITALSGKDADGNVERIIDRDESASQVPRISIGIALGGLRSPTHSE